MRFSRPSQLRHAVLLLASALLLTACGDASESSKGSGGSADDERREPAEVERVEYPTDPDDVEEWEGEVVLEREGDANGEATRVLEADAFTQVIDAVNERMHLPHDITVQLTDDADVEDSQYDYGTGVVSYPWEDFTETRELLEEDGYEGDALDDAAIAANQYFLAREIGHAVADQLTIPTLGRLEDAVDGFGSYVGVTFLEDTTLPAAAAGVYASYAAQDDADDGDFAQGHSVDEQRWFTAVCQAYGAEAEAEADENPYEALVEESGLPQERVEGCANEWTEMETSWETLLAPYLEDVDLERTYGVPPEDDIEEWDGEFVIEYATRDSREAAPLIEGGELEAVADALNEELALPTDVKVVVGDPESEADGPHFDGKSTIYLPWGYVEETRTALREFGYEGEELDAGVRNSAAGTILHEAGHVFSILLSLPVVGREEDSADSFEIYAAINLLEQPEFGIADADVMGGASNQADVDEESYVDVHAVDAQRYYQAYCQIYGSDPEEFEYLAEGDTFDEERLEECPDEWDAVEYGWDTLLEPYREG